MGITRADFGTAEGAPVQRYTLTNDTGIAAEIMTYGGTLLALRAPDRHGRTADILLGFDELEPYLGAQPYIGALIGRYGNRIAEGRFTLDGATYTLGRNNGPNNLHGGPIGFDRAVWRTEVLSDGAEPSLALQHLSPDGDQGFPGALAATVTYTLTAANELRIDYDATADRPTVVNLTNHAYFNLAGAGDVLGHTLELAATRFVPVNANLIPTGELRPVDGTPMDFRAPTPIGARIAAADEQIAIANGGYDHTWVLDGAGLAFAARVADPASGRVLEVYTTQPGVQFYSGNFLDGTLVGKGGQAYAKHAGLCLETQHFPDSPNQPQFPSTVLRPGERYRHTTVFRLGVA
ncbi:MAG TPA: aldose epimerase family protein [Kouleothrix sp.]|uniref:aldose epimerase family protein n=1 Tax=Kouleothrix sp. TaxID=2779161 RepID=UPI002C33F725|nr:aldose epimerase family protein [Kouleothrix sp.]HRC75529.1 aldose epimerase family protein [Kouleothrix sp.]